MSTNAANIISTHSFVFSADIFYLCAKRNDREPIQALAIWRERA